MDMNGSVPLMAEAAMNVIKRVYRPVDVMEVKIKDEDVTKKLRPLYASGRYVFIPFYAFEIRFLLIDDPHFHKIFD